MDLKRKPRIGMLFIGAQRFCPLGEGTTNGTYLTRKLQECENYANAVREHATVIASGVVCTRVEAEQWAKRFYAEDVDCVVAIFLSWAEDTPWIAFLRELYSVPLMLASVVRDSLAITDTGDEDQFVDFLSAGALVGFLEASGSLKRFARPMTALEIGTLEVLVPKIMVFAAAAKTRTILRRSRISLLACYNRAMWSTYVDPYGVFQKVGPELEFLAVADLVAEIEQMPEACVDAVLEGLKKRYRMMDSVNEEVFRASVKATLAMEKLALDAKTDLLVLNDIDTTLFRHVGLRPGFTPTDEALELVTVPEGDIGGGLAVYILRALTGKVANFIEPFYIDHARGSFAAGHAGPNDYTACPQNVVIARDERFAKSAWKHAGAPFAWYVFPAGEKTMLHASEENGRLKLVATVVECLPTMHYLASYSHADFRHPSLSPEELFCRIGEIGVNQHYAIAPGNALPEIEMLARLMDFDCHIIAP